MCHVSEVRDPGNRVDWVGIDQKWGRSFLRAVTTAHTLWLYPPAAKRPEDVCGPTQFRCVSTNTCISASFHCDEESDCPDRSDEFGCSEQGAGGELGALGWVPGALSIVSASTVSHLTPLSHSPHSFSLCLSQLSLLLPSPSGPPGGDPSPGVNPGFPGPDSDVHLCGHWRPHPHHQLAAQLGPHPLSSQVRLWAQAGNGAVGEAGLVSQA